MLHRRMRSESRRPSNCQTQKRRQTNKNRDGALLERVRAAMLQGYKAASSMVVVVVVVVAVVVAIYGAQRILKHTTVKASAVAIVLVRIG